MSSSVKLRGRPSSASVVGVLVFSTFTLKVAWNDVQDIDIALSLLVLTALTSMLFLFVEPINQPQKYHDFADKRLFLCACHYPSAGLFLPPSIDTGRNRRAGFIIPNFGDVVSNCVILIGGLSGAILLCLIDTGEVDEMRLWQLQVCLPIFFYATIAISCGSTYYHWNPNNNTLVWDRLPMTVAFVSIFCYMLEDYYPVPGLGPHLLAPLICIGVISVLYWHWTDDLRLYALVQFLPLVVMTGFVLLCQSRNGGVFQQALALMLYALAKISEDRDYEIWAMTKNTLSGHSLKHILAGMASVLIASMLLNVN